MVPAEQGPAAHAAPTVLVIDDEDYVANMLATLLDLVGYDVHVAYNGRDGLAQALALQPQAIIVDIMMPYLSGEALVWQLYEQADAQAAPLVLLISAGARPRKIPPSASFLPKPFEIAQLIDWLEAQLGPIGPAK